MAKPFLKVTHLHSPKKRQTSKVGELEAVFLHHFVLQRDTRSSQGFMNERTHWAFVLTVHCLL